MTLVRILAALSIASAIPCIAPADAVAQRAPTPAAGFDLVTDGMAPAIFVSPGDAPVVEIAARAFAGDVERVTGVRPDVSRETPGGDTAILAGTIGGSALFERLLAVLGIAVD
jgi:hypothetical protein